MVSLVGFLYYFFKTWRTDPGYIKSSEKEKKEVGDCKISGRASMLHCVFPSG